MLACLCLLGKGTQQTVSNLDSYILKNTAATTKPDALYDSWYVLVVTASIMCK